MIVYVINKHGETLMPCKPRKARILIKEKKAKIINYNPFTIQLIYGSRGYKQNITVGIDTGSKHIGVAIVSENKVLYKAEIELRQDVKENLQSRKIYRRARRNKLRYRQPRFLNRTRKEGWLPPSIESRIQNTFTWIRKITSRLPNPKLNIEVGKFDIQKIINPDISGKEYQEGNCKDYYDVRHYVFARDKYTCQICKKKDGILVQHHIKQRKDGGSNKADNLIALHDTCHQDFHQGKIQKKFTKPKEYKESTFMNIIRKRIFKEFDCNITYGGTTKPKRKELNLEKTHYNDAIAICSPDTVKKNINFIEYIKQTRKKKRSLHEAIPRKGRKTKNTTQKRNSKNTKNILNGLWCLHDKIKLGKQVGFISGFSGKQVYIKDIEDNYIQSTEKYKQVNTKLIDLVCRNNNWISAIHPTTFA